MKKLKTLFVAAFVLFAFVETSAQFSVGTDIYSSYVFRGVKFGSGPAIQPYVDYSNGGFSVGAWGSVTYASDYQEMDLYASYTTGGLTLGVYDYYYPGTAFFDVSDTTGSHGIELNLGYEVDGFSIAANYIVNEAPGAGTVGGDKYFELGYAFETFSLFVGAGDG
ncbi:MAG: hypothetical protein K9I99_08375, partial [Melioribacteraceae bacterium]|nr:hypothetical protein [Melioribacteraceae bacterium]